MPQIIQNHFRIITVIGFVLGASIFYLFLVDFSHASQVTLRFDNLNNATPSATSNHAITFTVQDNVVSQACAAGSNPCNGTASSNFGIIFPSDFNLGPITCNDIDLSTGTPVLLNVASISNPQKVYTPESETPYFFINTSWRTPYNEG